MSEAFPHKKGAQQGFLMDTKAAKLTFFKLKDAKAKAQSWQAANYPLLKLLAAKSALQAAGFFPKLLRS